MSKKEIDYCEGKVRVRGNRYLEKARRSCLIRQLSKLDTRNDFRIACIELIDLYREFKNLAVLALRREVLEIFLDTIPEQL